MQVWLIKVVAFPHDRQYQDSTEAKVEFSYACYRNQAHVQDLPFDQNPRKNLGQKMNSFGYFTCTTKFFLFCQVYFIFSENQQSLCSTILPG